MYVQRDAPTVEVSCIRQIILEVLLGCRRSIESIIKNVTVIVVISAESAQPHPQYAFLVEFGL